jgi:5-hydroxyisourate hydrolase
MSGISTHVLDTALGKPAAEVPVLLEYWQPGIGWKILGRASTDADGRCRDLTREHALSEGLHRLTFDAGAYFKLREAETFFPEVVVVFDVRDANAHHHVPLLLSPYGYSTYRGT